MSPVILLSLAAVASTLAGGAVALRFKDRLHYIMALTAGILLGVVGFDLLPEIIEAIGAGAFNPLQATIPLVVGFLAFHTLEKAVAIHHGHEEEYADHRHPHVGIVSALALIGHSVLDGVGIGLGFHVSASMGIAVAIAVIAHDFSDGMNTVSLMLSHKNTPASSKAFLALDAFAPLLGAASTVFFTLSPLSLVRYLGFFTGFLLYIGASDILPEAHSRHSSYRLILLTVFGAACMFLVTRFA